MLANALPFQRGTTYRGTSGTIDTSDYGESVYLEGMECETIAYDYSATNGVLTKLAGQSTQKCRVVRNVSGISLNAQKLVKYQTAKFKQRVDGYTTADWEMGAGVVDPALGSTVVRNGDLFWLVYQGPCTVITHTDGDIGNVIAEFEPLYAGTNAALTNTTDSGGVRGGEYAALTWAVADITDGTAHSLAFHSIGVALSAKTTANTGGAATLNTVLADLQLY